MTAPDGVKDGARVFHYDARSRLAEIYTLVEITCPEGAGGGGEAAAMMSGESLSTTVGPDMAENLATAAAQIRDQVGSFAALAAGEVDSNLLRARVPSTGGSTPLISGLDQLAPLGVAAAEGGGGSAESSTPCFDLKFLGAYTYDPFNRRAARLILESGPHNGFFFYTYDGWREVEELKLETGVNVVKNQYVWGQGTQRACCLREERQGAGGGHGAFAVGRRGAVRAGAPLLQAWSAVGGQGRQRGRFHRARTAALARGTRRAHALLAATHAVIQRCV